MTKIENMATEMILSKLLIETIANGIRCAQNERKEQSEYMKREYRGGVNVTANIIASILPGICPAQVQVGLRSISEDMIFPYGKITETDVKRVLEVIRNAWQKDAS